MSEENLDGLEAPDNLDTTEVTDISEAPEAAAPEPEETKVHPAYDKLLSELPEAWHEKVKPHLQEQDRNFQQQLEKFSPYKQFVEDGVDPSYITQSMQLAQAIAADPVTVHTNLTKALMEQGLIAEEAKQAAQEIMDDAESDIYEEEALTPAMKKELEKRDAELKEIREQMSKADLDKATEVELQKLNSEFDSLRNSYNVTPAQEQAILELMDVASARGQDLGVFEAAKKLVDLTGTGFKKKGAQPSEPGAPKVLGASGGNGVPFEAVEIPTDAKAKKEMLAQMFKDQMAK
jgi:hypothetical protein